MESRDLVPSSLAKSDPNPSAPVSRTCCQPLCTEMHLQLPMASAPGSISNHLIFLIPPSSDISKGTMPTCGVCVCTTQANHLCVYSREHCFRYTYLVKLTLYLCPSSNPAFLALLLYPWPQFHKRGSLHDASVYCRQWSLILHLVPLLYPFVCIFNKNKTSRICW